jgi:hypothetical protein
VGSREASPNVGPRLVPGPARLTHPQCAGRSRRPPRPWRPCPLPLCELTFAKGKDRPVDGHSRLRRAVGRLCPRPRENALAEAANTLCFAGVGGPETAVRQTGARTDRATGVSSVMARKHVLAEASRIREAAAVGALFGTGLTDPDQCYRCDRSQDYPKCGRVMSSDQQAPGRAGGAQAPRIPGLIAKDAPATPPAS